MHSYISKQQISMRLKRSSRGVIIEQVPVNRADYIYVKRSTTGGASKISRETIMLNYYREVWAYASNSCPDFIADARIRALSS